MHAKPVINPALPWSPDFDPAKFKALMAEVRADHPADFDAVHREISALGLKELQQSTTSQEGFSEPTSLRGQTGQTIHA